MLVLNSFIVDDVSLMANEFQSWEYCDPFCVKELVQVPSSLLKSELHPLDFFRRTYFL